MDCKISGIKRVIIIVYCIAVVLACIFVPWRGDFQATRAALGYSPIWLPPEDLEFRNFVVVDFERAVLEIVGITALGGIIFVLADSFEKYRSALKSKRKPTR